MAKIRVHHPQMRKKVVKKGTMMVNKRRDLYHPLHQSHLDPSHKRILSQGMERIRTVHHLKMRVKVKIIKMLI